MLRRNGSPSRGGGDARNLEMERLCSYHEIVCDKYNTESWVPVIKQIPLFHHEHSKSFDLPFVQKLTYKQVKRLLLEGHLNIVSILSCIFIYLKLAL